MNKIELLSPAKNLECGIAAINAGADAVYIGASEFGAREKAGNELADIEELIKYAHKYFAKVYVTVNTLMFDNEILRAKKLIDKLYNIYADGVIIQDPGLLELDLPHIKIIASTQMHNISSEKVNFYKDLGVGRFILPREFSLEDIKKMKAETDAELECFVHGALCVSYSGQCYLSFGIGGRSANRGACAQPCRKLYSLYTGQGKLIQKNKYFLSLKDLCLADRLEDLIDAGVTCFKIEGRLKDKDYVTNVVSYYRRRLDEIIKRRNLERLSYGESIIDFEPNVNKSFNRGFTDYFLDSKVNTEEHKVASIYTPKMIGECVGEVKKILGRRVFIDTKEDMHPGDGVSYFDKLKALRGTTVNGVFEGGIELNEAKQVEIGTIIYRNNDHEYNKSLSRANVRRLIDVNIDVDYFSVACDMCDTPPVVNKETLVFTITDENGFSAKYVYNAPFELAENKEKALENINNQLSKLGDGYFRCKSVNINIEDIPFFPISVLNDIRRNLHEELAKVREDSYKCEECEIVQSESKYIKTELKYSDNIINTYAREFYKFHGVESMEDGPETRIDMLGKQVMTTKYCLRNELDMCNEDRTENKPVCLLDGEGNQLKVTFNCRSCQMNVFIHKRGKVDN